MTHEPTPMNCSLLQDHIDDHVDGLLSAPQAERVRAHLDQCPDCREEAEASRLASTSLAEWGEEFGDLEPPEHCFDAILARIEALPPDALTRESPRPQRFAFLRGGRMPATLMGGAAAAAAAVLVVALQLTASHHPAQTGPAPVDPATRRAEPRLSAHRVAPAVTATVAPQPAVAAATASGNTIHAVLNGSSDATPRVAPASLGSSVPALGLGDWIEDQGVRRRRIILRQTSFPANLPGSPMPADFESGRLYPR